MTMGVGGGVRRHVVGRAARRADLEERAQPGRRDAREGPRHVPVEMAHQGGSDSRVATPSVVSIDLADDTRTFDGYRAMGVRTTTAVNAPLVSTKAR